MFITRIIYIPIKIMRNVIMIKKRKKEESD